MKQYSCTSCDFEQFIGDYSSIPLFCPNCESKSCRVVYNVQPREKSKFVNICYGENERWSWAMGVNRQKIPEMMKKYPNRTYHPKTGQLLVKNRTEKKRLMREHNMEEYG